MSYVLRLLDAGGQVAGWVDENDQLINYAWGAREFATHAAAEAARAALADRLGVPDAWGLGEVDIHELPTPTMSGHQLHRLGKVERGDTVMVFSLTGWLGRDELATMKARLAEQIGHDEFGLTVGTRTVEGVQVIDGQAMAELGWVFIGSPGVCPSCGSDQVVVQADQIPARRCGGCGHSWSEYCAGRSAA